jgi:hypothetical protein
MDKRQSLICFILLLMSSMTEIVIAAEGNDETLSASSDVTNSSPAIEPEKTDGVEPTKHVNTATTSNKRHSIKMIVGGESEGGVAKRLTLPVKD